MSDLTTLGATKLAAYLQCPRRAAYTYNDGHREPTNSAMARGTATHAAIEFALRRQMGGALPTLDEVADAARDATTRAVAEVDWTQDDPTERDAMADRTIAYAQAYVRDVAPGLHVLDVERPFSVSIAGVAVSGRIDVLSERNGVTEVRDLKTASRAPTPAWGDPRYRMQLGVYAASLDEIDPPAGVLDTLVLSERKGRGKDAVATRSVAHHPIVITPDEMAEEMRAATEVLILVADAVKRGDYPRNPTACYAWMRPCPHMTRCMPSRASAVEISAATKAEIATRSADASEA